MSLQFYFGLLAKSKEEGCIDLIEKALTEKAREDGGFRDIDGLDTDKFMEGDYFVLDANGEAYEELGVCLTRRYKDLAEGPGAEEDKKYLYLEDIVNKYPDLELEIITEPMDGNEISERLTVYDEDIDLESDALTFVYINNMEDLEKALENEEVKKYLDSEYKGDKDKMLENYKDTTVVVKSPDWIKIEQGGTDYMFDFEFER